MAETLPLATVKARLSEIIDRISKQQDRVIVTRNGRPAAVLLSPDDLESLEETLAVLSDPQLLRQLREGRRHWCELTACLRLSELVHSLTESSPDVFGEVVVQRGLAKNPVYHRFRDESDAMLLVASASPDTTLRFFHVPILSAAELLSEAMVVPSALNAIVCRIDPA